MTDGTVTCGYKPLTRTKDDGTKTLPLSFDPMVIAVVCRRTNVPQFLQVKLFTQSLNAAPEECGST